MPAPESRGSANSMRDSPSICCIPESELRSTRKMRTPALLRNCALFAQPVEHESAAHGEAADCQKSQQFRNTGPNVQSVGEEADQGKGSSRAIQPDRNVYLGDLPIAKAKLQQQCYYPDRGNHDDGGGAEEGCPAGKRHQYGKRTDQQSRKDHIPAALFIGGGLGRGFGQRSSWQLAISIWPIRVR